MQAQYNGDFQEWPPGIFTNNTKGLK